MHASSGSPPDVEHLSSIIIIVSYVAGEQAVDNFNEGSFMCSMCDIIVIL